MAIYVQHNTQRQGPYTVAEVRSQLASGALSLKDHVCWTGHKDWIPLDGSPVLTPGFVDPDSAIRKKSDQPSGLSSFSIASVIAGVLFPMAFFTSVPAIILGHCALDDLKNNPARTGRRMAYVGLALGYFFTMAWGALVGWYYLDYDSIQTMKDREDAMHSELLLPKYATPTTNAAPTR
jgi:hypothetical protein